MYNIDIEAPYYSYHMQLNHKFNIIMGDSGTGKTKFIQYLMSDALTAKVSTYRDYEPILLTKRTFNRIMRNALKCTQTIENPQERSKILRNYFKQNSPFSDSIVIIDDEDFVMSRDFADFYNADISNIYIIFDRTNISTIGYSLDAVYTMGPNNLQPAIYYDVQEEPITAAAIEGEGSDLAFFSKFFGEDQQTFRGRSNFVSFINKTKYSGAVLADKCAFGHDYLVALPYIEALGLHITLPYDYESFEHFVLQCYYPQVLCDISEDFKLQFISDEQMYEALLYSASEGRYSKKYSQFSKIS